MDDILGNMDYAINEKRKALEEKKVVLTAAIEAAQAEIQIDKEQLEQMEADRTLTEQTMFVIGKRWVEPVRRLW